VRGARNQGEILDALCPLLVAAMRPPIDVPHGAAIFKALRARASDKGPMTVEQRNLVRTAIAEILRERLKLALPTSHR
jgi:hypothetical protein